MTPGMPHQRRVAFPGQRRLAIDALRSEALWVLWPYLHPLPAGFRIRV